MNYLLTPEAEGELADAVDFHVANVSLNVARDFLVKFEEKVQLLTEFPGIGTPATKGRRLFPIGRYPYSILYRVHDGVLRVSTIAAHARRPRYWHR